jgi:alpha-beta hydrolase superfamily lysophospholipase
VFWGVHKLLPYAIICPMRTNEPTKPESIGLQSDSFQLKATENIQLQGYWIHAKTAKTKAIIILVHGIGGCKEHFLEISNQLASKGIATIIFDGRAHGKSGGEFCTYGFYEKQDISKIVDFIQSKNPTLPIGIWGNSLGGAVAIQALAFDKRINFGIIESTFTDLSQIVSDYQQRILGIRLRFISNYALKRAGDIAKFNPNEVKPIESVKQIFQPVFMAHGDADANISFHYGQQLFDNLASKEKEFTLVKGAGHFDLGAKGGKAYQDKLMGFIEKYVFYPYSL